MDNSEFVEIPTDLMAGVLNPGVVVFTGNRLGFFEGDKLLVDMGRKAMRGQRVLVENDEGDWQIREAFDVQSRGEVKGVVVCVLPEYGVLDDDLIL